MDENNEIIKLADSTGKETPFEVVKVIRYNDKDYMILHPLEPFEGLSEDSCVIFEMKEVDEESVDLILVTDDDTLDSVYAMYVEWATNVEANGCSGNCSGCQGCE